MFVFDSKTSTFEQRNVFNENLTGSMSASIAENNEWIFIASKDNIFVYQYCEDEEELHFENISSNNESEIFMDQKISKSFEYLFVVLNEELRIYPIDIL